MPHLDNHVMMTLKLGQGSQDHTLRAFEIEGEIAQERHRRQSVSTKRTRRISLGNLKMLWARIA